MGSQLLYFLKRYRILIDASFNNDQRITPLTPTQISDYDFQVENIFLDILTRKTGQIIVEGIREEGYTVLIAPGRKGGKDPCNPFTAGPPRMKAPQLA
jgi:hypothetical protein